MSDPTRFSCVRMYDPEIIGRVSDGAAGEYAVTRDMAALGLPDDCRPVIFHCRTLTRGQRRLVEDQRSDKRKFELAFRYGVTSIDNLPAPNGGHRTWTPSRQKPDLALEDDAIDAIGLGDTDLWEIGSVVYARSFLALGTPLRCRLLDSSLAAWEAVVLRKERSAEQQTDSEMHAASPSH